MSVRKLSLVAALLLAACFATGASAAPLSLLLGTSVTGSFTTQFSPGVNFFDPANGDVPPNTLNIAGTTVTIATPAIEFGAVAGQSSTVTADFTDTTLTLSFAGPTPANSGSWHFAFTDTAFTGLSLAKNTDTWVNGGLSFSLTGDMLAIDWAGQGIPPGATPADPIPGVAAQIATFTFSKAATGGGGVPLPLGALAALPALALAARMARKAAGRMRKMAIG
jgi:hypothetical protein